MSACVPHILLAEDNRDLAMVLGFNLKRGGFQVTTVYSGRQAWEAAQNQQFDLVLTDYQMPEMDGTELCRALRSDVRYAETPLVLMSALCSELDVPGLPLGHNSVRKTRRNAYTKINDRISGHPTCTRFSCVFAKSASIG